MVQIAREGNRRIFNKPLAPFVPLAPLAAYNDHRFGVFSVRSLGAHGGRSCQHLPFDVAVRPLGHLAPAVFLAQRIADLEPRVELGLEPPEALVAGALDLEPVQPSSRACLISSQIRYSFPVMSLPVFALPIQ